MQKASKKPSGANGAVPRVSGADVDAAMHEVVAAARAQSAAPTQPVDDAAAAAKPTGEASETQDEVTSLREQLLRMAADFDNFRKRTRADQNEQRRFGIQSLVTDILPVVDNLSRALLHAPKDSQDPVIQGIQMVAKQFVDVLAYYGVKTFASQGMRFDPEKHEAVGQEASATSPPNTILTELQAGYMIHDRLLRPARVLVASQASGAEIF